MDKAKAIKKYVLQNKWNMQEICHMVGVTMTEAANLYKGYTGHELPEGMFVVGHDDVIEQIELAIKRNKHVLLHGEPGIGKTASAAYTIRKCGKIMRKINISDKRTGTLLAEVLFGAHRTSSQVVFLFDEVDNFHWRSHAYFTRVLKESQVPIIMTCNDRTRISKGTMSYLKKEGTIVRMFPPTPDDLRVFMERLFPDRLDEVNKIYHEDFRIVMRRLLYGYSGTYDKKVEITAEAAAGAILGDRHLKRRLERVKACKDPLSWVITWLDYNCARFFRDPTKLLEFLDGLARCDAKLYKTSNKHMATMLASLPSPGRRSALKFPAALFAAQKKPKKENAEVEIKKASPVSVKVEASTSYDPFNF